MGENSGISWTDHTFNPWMGCTKVSPACANCYAERDWDKRYGKVKWGDGGTRMKTSAENWKKPLKWNSEARLFVECVNPNCRHRWQLAAAMQESFCPKCGDPEAKSVRPRVFCASLADVFETWIGPIRDSGGSDIGWDE
jgi:ssDNA-binding Zn-finger/Zn-ribbon topoisomerase 1